jgi:hypothetical protein
MKHNLVKAMSGNLIFSSLCAMSFLLFAEFLASHTGIPELVFNIIAFGLLGFAGILGYGIRTKSTQIAKIVVLLDWVWVVLSLIIVVSGWVALKPMGVLGVLSIAVIVAGFAIWQQREA